MFDRKTPYMLQYLFNVQRELGGTRHWKSAISARAAIISSGCSIATRQFRAPAALRADGRIPNSPSSRRSATSPKPSTTRWRSSSRGGSITASRRSSATRSRNPTDNGSGIRTLNGDALFPQDSNCFECEWGLVDFRRAAPLRLVDALRAAVRRRQAVPAAGVGGRDSGWLAGQHIISMSSGFPGIRRPAPIAPTRAAPTARTLVSGQDPDAARGRSSSGSTRPRSCAAARSPTATLGGTASSGPGSSTSTCRSSGTSGSAAPRACSSGSRRSTRSTSPSGRPEHGADQPELRHESTARASRCASCSLA